MEEIKPKLLLADDDIDDCAFFIEALEALPVAATLTTVKDGVALMALLTSEPGKLPDVLFLDLNMPRKTGFECLSEMKVNDKLKDLPVVIISTSFNVDVVNLLYEKGANHYIRKPIHFSQLKKVIYEAIIITMGNRGKQPAREKFVIQA